MKQNHPLERAHIRESIAGEEDPGASLDIVRSIAAGATAPAPRIQIDCREGGARIAVNVEWQRCGTGTAADLLAVVVAHHGEIADAAWSTFARTGARSVALQVDETTDGLFYVSRIDEGIDGPRRPRTARGAP